MSIYDLVTRYLTGEMSETERDAFEAVLDDDEMLQRMVAVRRQRSETW